MYLGKKTCMLVVRMSEDELKALDLRLLELQAVLVNGLEKREKDGTRSARVRNVLRLVAMGTCFCPNHKGDNVSVGELVLPTLADCEAIN